MNAIHDDVLVQQPLKARPIGHIFTPWHMNPHPAVTRRNPRADQPPAPGIFAAVVVTVRAGVIWQTGHLRHVCPQGCSVCAMRVTPRAPNC
ncbi:hypothetical protein [Paracoccus amoyensis]|uniref:hypothetical protein n=1 Tax=Paracoccus amoyensis TaxID=2760093 RepID=UPI0016592800|nr:hypothetical protein [Paracoccus amoyensis]